MYSDYIPVYTTAVESSTIFTTSTVPLDTSLDILYSEYTDSDSALNSCEKGKSKSEDRRKGNGKGKSRRSGNSNSNSSSNSSITSVLTPIAEMVPPEDIDVITDSINN